jgi:uncharacterized membrane protein YtjA (UPF0391 family)
MLFWAAVFFGIAIVASVLDLAGIAHASTEIAKILFVIFLVLFGLSVVVSLIKRGRPPAP